MLKLAAKGLNRCRLCRTLQEHGASSTGAAAGRAVNANSERHPAGTTQPPPDFGLLAFKRTTRVVGRQEAGPRTKERAPADGC